MGESLHWLMKSCMKMAATLKVMQNEKSYGK